MNTKHIVYHSTISESLKCSLNISTLLCVDQHPNASCIWVCHLQAFVICFPFGNFGVYHLHTFVSHLTIFSLSSTDFCFHLHSSVSESAIYRLLLSKLEVWQSLSIFPFFQLKGEKIFHVGYPKPIHHCIITTPPLKRKSIL